MEADLRRFYGVRLADLWSGRESLRHIGALLRNLPPEATLVSVLPVPEDTGPAKPPRWGYAEYLLADVVDALAAANWQRGGGKSQRPAPYPRPRRVRVREVTSGLTDEQRAILAARGPRRSDV